MNELNKVINELQKKVNEGIANEHDKQLLELLKVHRMLRE